MFTTKVRSFIGPGLRSISIVAIMGIVAGCATGGAANGGSSSAEDPVTLTTDQQGPAEGAPGRAIQAMGEEVEKRTGGMVRMEHFYSSSLLPSDEKLSGVSSGTADVGVITTSYFPDDLPASNLILALGSLNNKAYPYGLIAGSAALHEFFLESEQIQEEYARHNLKILEGTNRSQDFNLLCREPVRSLADAEGLRVRTGGAVYVAELEALGMVPVSLPINETYEALQRGVVDCLSGTPSTFVDYGLWEVANHFIPVSLSSYPGGAVVMNLDTWNELSADSQDAVRDAAVEFWQVDVGSSADNYAKFAEEGEEYDLVWHAPLDMEEVLRAHQETSVAALLESGAEGVQDVETFIEEYRSYLTKWESIVADDLGMPSASLLDEPSPDALRRAYLDQYDVTAVADMLREELAD